MYFAYDHDQELLQATSRRYLRDHHSIEVVRERREQNPRFDRTDWAALAELGWTSMLIPEEFGGGSVTGQGVVDASALAEVIGAALHSGPFVPCNVVAHAISVYGTDTQRKNFLPSIASGALIATWCIGASRDWRVREPDVAGRKTAAGIVVDGTVMFVEAGRSADLLLVPITLEGRNRNVFVPCSSPGVSIRRLEALDLTRDFCAVSFDNVEVAVDSMLDDEDNGSSIILELLDLAAVLQASDSFGGARTLLTATAEYVKQRVQFDRPVGSFQAVKHNLANAYVCVESIGVATKLAALAVTEGFGDRHELALMAKFTAADGYRDVCERCLHAHGGIGMTWESDVHLFLRRSWANGRLYGTPETARDRLASLLVHRVQ